MIHHCRLYSGVTRCSQAATRHWNTDRSVYIIAYSLSIHSPTFSIGSCQKISVPQVPRVATKPNRWPGLGRMKAVGTPALIPPMRHHHPMDFRPLLLHLGVLSGTTQMSCGRLSVKGSTEVPSILEWFSPEVHHQFTERSSRYCHPFLSQSSSLL